MESGAIKDSAVSASSAYDAGSVGPQHGRLRNDKNGGAWCPRQMVSRDAKEYLEINLEELHVITGVRTQGRFGNGQGQEYAEEYMIEYWRPGFTAWVRWKNREGKECEGPYLVGVGCDVELECWKNTSDVEYWRKRLMLSGMALLQDVVTALDSVYQSCSYNVCEELSDNEAEACNEVADVLHRSDIEGLRIKKQSRKGLENAIKANLEQLSTARNLKPKKYLDYLFSTK
ncbi:hypothetical protein ILUMI_08645 [Ignelater luminosus]|uniref:F5/8 type C domain-containing protein n=1 Tax=Ignelater luminosus TaxID=2038154 RepID=A0A8K0D197_IGNLU|nr:hypothetical protein ILUMI_08645 [Ignelater luminosus]